MAHIKHLHINQCPKLMELSIKCRNLETLSCIDNQTLIKLPETMPELKYLDCVNCFRLESLPKGCCDLRFLMASNCYVIKEIPNYPCVVKVDVSVCMNLTQMHNLNNVIRLNVTSTRIETLSEGMSKLEVLYIYNCPNLLSLPLGMTMLKKIDYRDSPLIKSLPKDVPTHVHVIQNEDEQNLDSDSYSVYSDSDND